MILTSDHADQFGYYIVAGQKFHSKYDAILHSHSLRDHEINFVFNDHVYDQYDWTKEPTLSLDALYARRAQELREKYDYLVLHYSGGYDSGNILETFARNGIALDEIYMRGSISTSVIDKTITAAHNQYAETYLLSLPTAQWVKENFMPDVKFTVQDTVQYVIDRWQHMHDAVDHQYALADFSPSTVIKQDYDELNPEYKRMTDQGKKVAHIIGMEKPEIYYQDGRYWTRFLDKFSALHTPSRFSRSQMPIYQEPFYWCTSGAEIIIKQCHVVKRYIESHGLDPNLLNRISGVDKHHFLGKIIYNRQMPMPWYPDKDGGEVRSCDWFFFKDKNTTHYQNWHKLVQHIRSVLPAQWLQNDMNQTTGIFSKSRLIG